MTPKRTAARAAGLADDGITRLVKEIGGAIQEGRLEQGERLAPARRLAEQYGISFNTVLKATGRLETMGLVRRVRGSGTYVTYAAPDSSAQTKRVYLLINSMDHVYGLIGASVVDRLLNGPHFPVFVTWRRDRAADQFEHLLSAFRREPPHAIILQWWVPGLDKAIAEEV